MKHGSQSAVLSPADYHDATDISERRGHYRQIATLRLAKLRSGGREGWGFIKNLSASGMMLEVYPEFDLGDYVEILVSEEKCVSGGVKWRKDGLAGVEFHNPVDIAEILKIAPVSNKGKIPRLPRVHMQHPVTIRSGRISAKADICDISPSGMCVITDHVFEPGKSLTLIVPQLANISGTVRWQSDGRVGIAFDERLSIHNVMNWLSNYYGRSGMHIIEEPPKSGDLVDHALGPAVYHVFGLDDLGRKVQVATLQTASLALISIKAAANYFDGVCVTNECGVELPLIALRLKVIEEEKLHRPIRSRARRLDVGLSAWNDACP